MSRSSIDWDLAEKLLQVPCSLSDAAIALGVSYPALVRAINKHRRDLVLPFAQAGARAMARKETVEEMQERARQILAVVQKHNDQRKAWSDYAERH